MQKLKSKSLIPENYINHSLGDSNTDFGKINYSLVKKDFCVTNN